MARSEGFYERFAKSVAPSIFGSLGSQTGNPVHVFSYSYSLTISGRYQEGHYVSAHGRLEEDSARRYATARRHQRPSAGRSGYGEVPAAQVRRKGRTHRRLYIRQGF